VQPVADHGLAHAVRPIWAEIDREAIAANVAMVRSWLTTGVALTASVKANAYGHGVAEVVRVLEAAGVDQVMTASLADARTIRASGSRVRIVMLAGSLPNALPSYLQEDVIPTIYSLAAAEALSRETTRPTEVYVKVDAGLGRVGVAIDDAASFVRSVVRVPRVIVGGIYTHLPFASKRGEAWARVRLRRFNAVLQELRVSGIDVPYRQAVSSSGVLVGLESEELSAVCVGSLLYGISTVHTPLENRRGLTPALSSIRAQVIDVARHSTTRTAGSGGGRRYAAGTATGVIPVGLQDGYRAPGPGKVLHVLVNGRRARVVGVSLAYTVIQLPSPQRVSVGEEVVLIGHQGGDEISLYEVARATNTTVLDVLTRLNGRIPYEYAQGTSRSLEGRQDTMRRSEY
jgi:alanine racemase